MSAPGAVPFTRETILVVYLLLFASRYVFVYLRYNIEGVVFFYRIPFPFDIVEFIYNGLVVGAQV
jgi:hypothetical protein